MPLQSIMWSMALLIFDTAGFSFEKANVWYICELKLKNYQALVVEFGMVFSNFDFCSFLLAKFDSSSAIIE